MDARYSTSKTNWSLSTNRNGPSKTKSPAALNLTEAASAPDKVELVLQQRQGLLQPVFVNL